MNLDEIKKLLKLVEKSDIEELEIEEEGKRIKVTKGSGVVVAAPAQQVVQLPATPAPAPAQAVAPAQPAAEEDDGNPHAVKSPMVGTFYSAASPDSPPYVAVGDVVKKGQTLCIIEAMKLMNEIEADVSGKVVSICVENAEPVEYGAALFKIDPS